MEKLSYEKTFESANTDDVGMTITGRASLACLEFGQQHGNGKAACSSAGRMISGFYCYFCQRKGISISKFILSTGLFVEVNL